MRLRKRLPSDLPQVRDLLSQAGLPAEGLERTEGWVAERGGLLLGHVALEAAGEAAVLRSLVVDPSRRGQGLGARLMAEAEGAAAGRALVLKTDTVGSWMLRRGYRSATLDQVPASVRTTTQFSGSLCAGTPVYLKEGVPGGEAIKAAVRERYADVVTRGRGCCGSGSGCCAGASEDPSLRLGYAPGDVEAAPEGANLGLGCGNPVALASLKPGDTVLDLGSGAGFDAFLASRRVGPEGQVIGVDMTPAMVERARALAARHGFANVAFREGDIEALPLEDACVDVVISNCVINLATDKARVFREAFRVLKPGGRLMVSDLVLLGRLPEALRQDPDAYAACVAGALPKEEYLSAIRAAGFQEVEVVGQAAYDLGGAERAWSAGAEPWDASEGVASLQVRGRRPVA